VNLPLPQPPDDRVADVLDALAGARSELVDAQRIVTMLRVGLDDPEAPAAGVVATARTLIELQVAERRVEAWQRVVEQVEHRAHSLGLQP
jgi:hypothetical protein